MHAPPPLHPSGSLIVPQRSLYSASIVARIVGTRVVDAYQRQPHGEVASAAQAVAADLDASAMEIDRLFDDGEANAEAALRIFFAPMQ